MQIGVYRHQKQVIETYTEQFLEIFCLKETLTSLTQFLGCLYAIPLT
jgi:hypothetical protein